MSQGYGQNNFEAWPFSTICIGQHCELLASNDNKNYQ